MQSVLREVDDDDYRELHLDSVTNDGDILKTPDHENSQSDSIDDDGSKPLPKKKLNSGHKVGFKEQWAENRPWLYSLTIIDEGKQNQVKTVMKCYLCTTYQLAGGSGQCKAWSETGYAILRLDKIIGSHPHRNAVIAGVEKQNLSMYWIRHHHRH